LRAVLERDFVSGTTRPRAFLARAILGALVGGAVLLAWAATPEWRRDRPDETGAMLFQVGAATLLALIALLAPTLASGVILVERSRDTLPLLLATPVGPVRIALAKLLACGGTVLSFAAGAVPPLTLVVLFGGVSGADILRFVAFALALTLEQSAWGVWVSSRTRKVATGIVLSLLLPLVRWVGTMLLLLLITRGNDDLFRTTAFHVVISTTPFFSLFSIFEPGEVLREMSRSGITSPLAQVLLHPVTIYAAFAVLWAGLAVWSASRRLAVEAEPAVPRGVLARLRPRWFDRLREGLRARLRRPLQDGANPMTWKETRLLNTASSRVLYYGVLAFMLATETFFLFVVGPELGRGSRSDDWHGLLSFHSAAIGLVAVVSGAAAMAHEKTQGTYDLLRATLLSPGDIARGKTAGVLAGLLLLVAVPVGHLSILVVAGSLHPLAAAGGMALLLVHAWLFAVIGLHRGAVESSAARAVTKALVAYVVVLALCPLAYLLYGVFVQFRGDGPVEWILPGSPLVAIPSLMGFLEQSARGNLTGWARDWALGSAAWSGLWLLVAAVRHLGLARAIARDLDREAGPAPVPTPAGALP